MVRKSTQKKVELALLLLLVLLVLVVLWRLREDGCGDGVCDLDETPQTCPTDCRCGDRVCSRNEDCPADCSREPVTPPEESARRDVPSTAPDVARATDPAGPPPVADDSGVESAPSCRDADLRAILRRVVRDCGEACLRETPLVSLSEEQFTAMFGREDDRGFASFFALFGCNIYNRSLDDCFGYDAYYTNPQDCPDEPGEYEGVRLGLRRGQNPNRQCRNYSQPIHDGLRRFIENHQDARYIVLIGTASRTGNRGGVMNPKNVALAKSRAENVRRLLLGWAKPPPAGPGLKVPEQMPVVVLDNEKHRFDEASGRIREIVAAQIAEESRYDRGFRPTQDNAINRSVMVLAIGCRLE